MVSCALVAKVLDEAFFGLYCTGPVLLFDLEAQVADGDVCVEEVDVALVDLRDQLVLVNCHCFPSVLLCLLVK